MSNDETGVVNVVCLIGHRSTSDDLYLCRKKLFTSPSPCDQFFATFFPISLRRGHAISIAELETRLKTSFLFDQITSMGILIGYHFRGYRLVW